MLLQTLSVLSFYMVILFLILIFVSCWRYWNWFESHKKKRIVNFFRRAYVWVLIHSTWAMVISYFINSIVWICMGLIFATAVLIHQKLLPAITNAQDGGDRKKMAEADFTFCFNYFGPSRVVGNSNRISLICIISMCSQDMNLRVWAQFPLRSMN